MGGGGVLLARLNLAPAKPLKLGRWWGGVRSRVNNSLNRPIQEFRPVYGNITCE